MSAQHHASHIYAQDLPKTPANFAPITPLSFIERTAQVYPQRTAIVHGALRQTWAQTYARCRQLASALQRRGIGLGDTVAVMLPNTPPGLLRGNAFRTVGSRNRASPSSASLPIGRPARHGGRPAERVVRLSRRSFLVSFPRSAIRFWQLRLFFCFWFWVCHGAGDLVRHGAPLSA